jgi:integrase
MDTNTWPTGVRPSGSGIRIKIWRDGRLAHSETLPGDPYSARDLAAAVRRRDELKARLRIGLPLFTGDEGAQQQQFLQVCQEYLDTLDAKRSTHLSYEQILNRYWLPEFATWVASEIRTNDIKRQLAKLTVSAKTKRNALIPLRCVLRYAGVHPNPVEQVVVKRAQKEPVMRYTPEQRDKLLGLLQGQSRVYFAVLFGCGLRPGGEALALRWSDYDGEELNINKQITRRRLEHSTKTNVARKVYVPTWVRTILNNHTTRFQGEYIFVNSVGGPYLDTDVFNADWKAVHKKARFQYRVPYACRHTRAAELLSSGVDPAEAAKQLGHSLEMFLRTYSEWIEEYAGKRDKSRFEGVSAKTKSA